MTLNKTNTNSFNENAFEKINGEFNKYLLWGDTPKTKEEKYLDTLRVAFVFEKEKEKHTMLIVSNLDMKAYKVTEYYEPIIPLEEVEYIKFERWARSMDM